MPSLAGLQCNVSQTPATPPWNKAVSLSLNENSMLDYVISLAAYPAGSELVAKVPYNTNVSIGDLVEVNTRHGTYYFVVQDVDYVYDGRVAYKQIRGQDVLAEFRDLYIERCWINTDVDQIIMDMITENAGYAYTSPGVTGKTITLAHRGRIGDVLAGLLQGANWVLVSSYDPVSGQWTVSAQAVNTGTTPDITVDNTGGYKMREYRMPGTGTYSRVRVLGGYVTEKIQVNVSCTYDATTATFTCTRADTGDDVGGPSLFEMGEEIVGDVTVYQLVSEDLNCADQTCITGVLARGTAIEVSYQSTPQANFSIGFEYTRRRRVVAEAEDATLVSQVGRRTYTYTDAGILDDVVASQVAQDILSGFKTPEYTTVEGIVAASGCSDVTCIGKLMQVTDPITGLTASGVVTRIELRRNRVTYRLAKGRPRIIWRDIYELSRKLSSLEAAGGFFQ